MEKLLTSGWLIILIEISYAILQRFWSVQFCRNLGLESIQQDFRLIQQDFGSIQQNYGPIQRKLGSIKQKFGSIQQKFGSIQQKFRWIQQKLESVLQKFGSILQKFEAFQQTYFQFCRILKIGHKLKINHSDQTSTFPLWTGCRAEKVTNRKLITIL